MSEQEPAVGTPIGEQEFIAWTTSEEMDRATAYCARGRAHVQLSDEALIKEWVSAVKAFCLDPGSPEMRRAESDLKAEMDVRGHPAPFHAVEAELQLLHQRFGEAIERLSRDNPQEFARINAELAGLVDDFQTRMAASQN